MPEQPATLSVVMAVSNEGSIIHEIVARSGAAGSEELIIVDDVRPTARG